MSNTNNGGPAFPCEVGPEADDYMIQTGNRKWLQAGMSLRDYFAAHAPDVPDDFAWADGESDCYQRVIRWRWFYADAMLEARK